MLWLLDTEDCGDIQTLRSERRGEGGRGERGEEEPCERGEGGGLNFLWKGCMEGGDSLDDDNLCLAGMGTWE